MDKNSFVSWMGWSRRHLHREVFDFFRNMISFRKKHPLLRRRSYFRNVDNSNSGESDISWHVAVDTAMPYCEDIFSRGNEVKLQSKMSFSLIGAVRFNSAAIAFRVSRFFRA